MKVKFMSAIMQSLLPQMLSCFFFSYALITKLSNIAGQVCSQDFDWRGGGGVGTLSDPQRGFEPNNKIFLFEKRLRSSAVARTNEVRGTNRKWGSTKLDWTYARKN